jgi:ABC-2 type transport system permease protein
MLILDLSKEVHKMPPQTLRVVYSAFRMAMLHWVADPQWVIPNVIAPFVFTVVALTLFKNVTGPFALYAVLGGGMMGMWGNTLYSSGFAIEFEKWQGTLENVLAAPSNLMHVIAGRSVSNALLGLTNMVAILLIAAFGFRVPLDIANPILFAVSLILTLLSVSALGLIFASAFVLSRSAQVFTNGLEFPIYIISGSMFPVMLLGPFEPVSYILGPKWGIDAIREAATYGNVSIDFWKNIGIMLLITVVYVAIATVLFKFVEKKARRDGTLVEA